MDWRNETAVCNAFVEAVHADNYALAGDARAALAKVWEDVQYCSERCRRHKAGARSG